MTRDSAFIHPQAICETEHLGAGTRVWAFAHLLGGAVVGSDCNICDGVFIENDVVIGSRVTIKCGVQLWDGTRIEDDVFIGPNATFTNDKFPRSRHTRTDCKPTIIGKGASIGANATILPGIEVGPEAMVGAGAVVTRQVPPHAIVVGNPARIKGYVGSKPGPGPVKVAERSLSQQGGALDHLLIRLPEHRDLRGSLVALGLSDLPPQDLPFLPSRMFMVFDVPSPEVRGEHAHRVCHQLLICVNGSVSVVADDGENRQNFVLSSRSDALHLPPMTWSMQYGHAEGSVLLVLASHPYDPGDYIRDYSAFLTARSDSGNQRSL
jgi:acetyltransferase-like isoleucine patch superfamily enzyme/dTDP-4-dehydrorhamnose 3,5-epimerase-like enzyme